MIEKNWIVSATLLLVASLPLAGKGQHIHVQLCRRGRQRHGRIDLWRGHGRDISSSL